MTAKPKPDYYPAPNGLASLVIGFFENHPSEYLTLEDVADKFDCNIINLRKSLQPAVDAGLLTCSRDGLDNYIYRGGMNLPIAPEAGTTSQGAEVKRRGLPSAPGRIYGAGPVCQPGPTHQAAPRTPTTNYTATRKTLDFDLLVVEEGVPYLNSPNHGKSKWAGLFEKLTRKGQSLQVPGDYRGAVACAASKQNKKKQGTYKVGSVDNGLARVWRTA
jgi:hypothetical protein